MEKNTVKKYLELSPYPVNRHNASGDSGANNNSSWLRDGCLRLGPSLNIYLELITGGGRVPFFSEVEPVMSCTGSSK